MSLPEGYQALTHSVRGRRSKSIVRIEQSKWHQNVAISDEIVSKLGIVKGDRVDVGVSSDGKVALMKGKTFKCWGAGRGKFLLFTASRLTHEYGFRHGPCAYEIKDGVLYFWQEREEASNEAQ